MTWTLIGCWLPLTIKAADISPHQLMLSSSGHVNPVVIPASVTIGDGCQGKQHRLQKGLEVF